MEAWVSLRSRRQTIAPDLPMTKVVVPGQAERQAAPALHGVPRHKAQLPCGTYQADVVLSQCNTKFAEVILMVARPGVHLINLPSR